MLLFVYGSLCSGQQHHNALLMTGAYYRGVAAVPGVLEQRVDGYSVLRPSHLGVIVRGELWAVPDFEHLDAFEGDGYQRADVLTTLGVTAQAYIGV